MRIVHCAPFNTITKSGGALYANPVKISLGLIENGCFVHNFDYRDTARYFSMFKNKKSGSGKMNAHFRKIVSEIKPDLVVFGHAELISDDSFEYVKQKNIPMIFWYNDVPFPAKLNQIKHYFSHIFTTAHSSLYSFLPNPVHSSIEHGLSWQKDTWKYDLLFSGRSDKEREELISFVKKNIPCKQKFIGQTKDTTIIGDKYFQTIIDSKICLNHNRNFSLKHKWFTSDRLMHILGNGSFALSTPIINGEDFFDDKLDYYHNLDELKDKVQYYLSHKKERLEKARWLNKRVHKLFSAKRVGTYILDTFAEKNLDSYEWYCG